jgi:hypothetical protein
MYRERRMRSIQCMNISYVRAGAVAAITGGLAASLLGLLHLLSLQYGAAETTAYIARGLLLAFTIIVLARIAARPLATVGAVLAVTGALLQVAMIVSAEVGIAVDFEGPLMPVALLGLLAGQILLGIAHFRAKALPVWVSAIVAFGILLTVVPVVGEILYGALFAAIGLSMYGKAAAEVVPTH